MGSEDMIETLLNKQSIQDLSVSPEAKSWVARTIGGIIVSDGRVDPSERVYLAQLLDALKADPETHRIVQEMLVSGEQVPVESIDLAPQEARDIFRYIVEVCICDNDLEAGEVAYLQQVGEALGLDEKHLAQSFDYAVLRSRGDFFDELLSELAPEERQWLACAILKVVYADGRVDRKEIFYLGNVYELLEENPDLLEEVRVKPRDFSLAILPKVNIKADYARRILKLLIEISLADGDAEEHETVAIEELAKSISFPADQLPELRTEVTRWHNLLFGQLS